MSRRFPVCGFALLAILAASAARATWSIVVVDIATREVGVASATCLENFNLRRFLPVVIPTVGVAAAQSLVDTTGVNRRRIWTRLMEGQDPNAILDFLAGADSSHQSRQYGIVDAFGRTVTFTGAQAGAYASGLVGHSGTLAYAIQGNVITGQAVLDQAELALLQTPGDMAAKLMAAMEAAHDMGGDGRCSCAGDPDSCGAPPPSFEKSAHVGFILVARRGDPPGDCNNGCANGTYFLALNIAGANGSGNSLDPVIQLRTQFDTWQAARVGQVDAVQSLAGVTPTFLPDQAPSPAVLRIELRDRGGAALPGPFTIAVAFDGPAGGSGAAMIGPVTPVDEGQGIYEVPLQAGMAVGHDRYRIDVTDGAGVTRTLMPSPALTIFDRRADRNSDGRVDDADLLLVLAAFGLGPGGDIDGDGDTDLDDLLLVLGNQTG
jgi:hypothetical protein